MVSSITFAHDFTKLIRAKGYTNVEVAERWGLSRVRLSQIAANPKPIHYDAVKGLPKRKVSL